MTKFERRVFILSNFTISTIGAGYLILKYLFGVETEYGQRPHVLTGDLLHLHIITVPLLVLSIGYLYGRHIYPKLKKNNPKRKKSGVFIILLFIFMTASGYILQVSTENISAVGYTHSIISVIWILASFWHSRKAS